MTSSAAASESLFFVLGRGRSGTTLLSCLLDAHSQVSMAPESLFALHLAPRYARASFRDPAAVRAFARDVWVEERMLRWGFDAVDLEARLLAVPDPGFERLVEEVYRLQAQQRGKRGARLLGDKNPLYSLFASRLGTLFPRARFVVLIRDYRANIASFRKVRFDLDSIAGLAERWRIYNQRLVAAAEARPDRFALLRYEDLVRRPEVELARLCRHLGLEYEPELLSRESDLPLPDWHVRARRPPSGRAVRQWERELSEADLRVADRVCQPLGRRFGYLESTAAARHPAAGIGIGVGLGKLFTLGERGLFGLPLELRAWLIRLYRRRTGNRIA